MKNSITKQGMFDLTAAAKFRFGMQLLWSRCREALEFDSPVIKMFVGMGGILLGRLLLKLQRVEQAFTVLSSIHAAGCSSWASHVVEEDIKASLVSRNRQSRPKEFAKLFRAHAEHLEPAAHTTKFFENPARMLGPMVIVLKKAMRNEKGAILILYSYALPLFAKLFDIERIAERYSLVLEPSWSGYCNLDILCYSQLDCPVFVQAYEPRDEEFIRSIRSNLIPVPLSNNWWIDHRVFRPLPNVTKDIDVIMVASWARFKRHHRFFEALRKLRSRGIRLKVVLIGYPGDKTRDIIGQEAQFYEIWDQLEIYELINAEQVNVHFNRAKVNVLWSRREGWNRALIEGLFAGGPCILRDGHNYGFAYPYINPLTGCYSSEKELPNKLLWMVDNYQQFSPREWVIRNMSCEKATEILSEFIKTVAVRLGERWTDDLVVKVNGLHGLQYLNSEDQRKFDEDYKFLEYCKRK